MVIMKLPHFYTIENLPGFKMPSLWAGFLRPSNNFC